MKYSFIYGNNTYVYDSLSGKLFLEKNKTADNIKDSKDSELVVSKEVYNAFQNIYKNVNKNKAKNLSFQNFKIKKITIVPTMKCNMRCTYCYEKESQISFEDGNIEDNQDFYRTLKWLLNNTVNCQTLQIQYYGGEPLLKIDFIKKCTKHILDFAEKRAISPKFSIITNGTLLSYDIIDFFKKNDFEVTISIDGGCLSDNSFRLMKNGASRFQNIVDNINLINKAGLKKLARVTLLPTNVERFEESLKKLYYMGFENIYYSPVLSNNSYFEFTKKNLAQLEIALGKLNDFLLDIYTKKRKILLLNTSKDLRDIYINADRRFSTCSFFDTKNLVLMMDGALFNCEKYIVNKEKKIGFKEKINFNILRQNILNRKVRKKCLACVAYRSCGGGCIAEREKYGIYTDTLCEIRKIQFKNSLKLYCAIKGDSIGYEEE